MVGGGVLGAGVGDWVGMCGGVPSGVLTTDLFGKT